MRQQTLNWWSLNVTPGAAFARPWRPAPGPHRKAWSRRMHGVTLTAFAFVERFQELDEPLRHRLQGDFRVRVPKQAPDLALDRTVQRSAVGTLVRAWSWRRGGRW